jgi:hypothetical protein
MPVFEPLDLIGRSFLLGDQDNGSCLHARIVKSIDDFDTKMAKDPARLKFLCNVGDDQYEEVLTYADILQHIEKDESTDIIWKFISILDHQGPLSPNDKKYNGSRYNVLLEWETGEKTWEPLGVIAKADPTTCAIYAKDKELLNAIGWKRF